MYYFFCIIFLHTHYLMLSFICPEKIICDYCNTDITNHPRRIYIKAKSPPYINFYICIKCAEK